MTIKSLTVGALRKATEGLPDDAVVLVDHPQAVGYLAVDRAEQARGESLRRGMKRVILWAKEDKGQPVLVIHVED